jgi:hypothetical protein
MDIMLCRKEAEQTFILYMDVGEEKQQETGSTREGRTATAELQPINAFLNIFERP